MNTDVMFSSKTDIWETPQWLFDKYDSRYHFTLDVCADANNAKCSAFFDEEADGLKQTWAGNCWMNPPYGREIGKWVKKAYEESKLGATVVCLLPSRTDTAWWHDYVMHGQVTFMRGRLKFGESKNSAPFPSAIVIFEKSHKERQQSNEVKEIS